MLRNFLLKLRSHQSAQDQAEQLIRDARADATFIIERITQNEQIKQADAAFVILGEACLPNYSDDRCLLELLITVASIGVAFMIIHDTVKRHAADLGNAIAKQTNEWIPNGWGIVSTFLTEVPKIEEQGLRLDHAISIWIQWNYAQSDTSEEDLFLWVAHSGFRTFIGYFIMEQFSDYWRQGVRHPDVPAMLLAAKDPQMLQILLASSRARRRYDPGKHERFNVEVRSW